MATNKRKEAAALFELLDKSTLKVPKSAGALKIPAWWSSKTNPTSGPVATTPSTIAPSPSHAMPVSRASTLNAPAKTSQPNPPEPPLRMYQPPVSPNGKSTTTAPSPSIRPPTPNNGLDSTSATPAPTTIAETRATPLFTPTTAPATTAPRPMTAPPAARAKTDAAPASPAKPAETSQIAARERVIAAGKKATAAPYARPLPRGLLIGLGSLAVIAIVLLAAMLRPRSSRSSTASVTTPGLTEHTDNSSEGPSLLPAGNIPATPVNNKPPAGDENQQTAGSNPPAPTSNARWYKPGEVQRSAALYYIIVATTPAADIAERNAKFLAEQGVEVSVETRNVDSRTLYTLVSVQGFPTIAAAEPLRKRIVEVGHLMPELKKQRKAWDDAYVRKVVSLSH